MNPPLRTFLGLILALGLAGCGGGGNPSPTSPSHGANPPAAVRVDGWNGSTADPGILIPEGSADGHQSSATDFGPVGNSLGEMIGKEVDKTYRITNLGSDPARILGVTLDGPAADQFSLTQAPETSPLPTHGSTPFRLTWRPFPKAVLGDNRASVVVSLPGGTFRFAIVGTLTESGHH